MGCLKRKGFGAAARPRPLPAALAFTVSSGARNHSLCCLCISSCRGSSLPAGQPCSHPRGPSGLGRWPDIRGRGPFRGAALPSWQSWALRSGSSSSAWSLWGCVSHLRDLKLPPATGCMAWTAVWPRGSSAPSPVGEAEGGDPHPMPCEGRESRGDTRERLPPSAR